MALQLTYPDPLSTFYGEGKIPGPILPVIAVPNRAGTGSEVTPVAVVSDNGRFAKTAAGIARVVDTVVAQGAKVRLGGQRPDRDGFYYPATVLTDVRPEAEILKDEIFGPVAAIVEFGTEDQVIALANDTEYGLAAYVFTQDLLRGLNVSQKLDYGMVGLNRGMVSDTAAPFGGVKQSGLGREGSHHDLLEFTECRYIVVTW